LVEVEEGANPGGFGGVGFVEFVGGCLCRVLYLKQGEFEVVAGIDQLDG